MVVIHLGDQNDNVPQLQKASEKVYVCLSDEETMTNITAEDLDLPPYSEPYHYELLGDVKGNWRIEPNPGTSFTLSLPFSPKIGITVDMDHGFMIQQFF